MATETLYLNLDDRTVKRQFMAHIGALVGQWRIELTRDLPRRSIQQNKFYRSVVVQAFYQFLRDQDYSIGSAEQAHEILKHKFAKEDIVHKPTGEVLETITQSTTKLDTAGMTRYIEACRAWLLDMFGVMTPDPDPIWKEAKQ